MQPLGKRNRPPTGPSATTDAVVKQKPDRKARQACLREIIDHRWSDTRCFTCPVCHQERYWVTSRGVVLCNPNKHPINLVAGTIFAKRHVPIETWFSIIRQCINAKTPLSARGLYESGTVGSEATALSVLTAIRSVMAKIRRPLYGTVCIDVVSIDQVVRAKPVPATSALPFVIVAVHRGDKHALAVALELSSEEELADKIRQLVKERVAPTRPLEIVPTYAHLDFGQRRKRVSGMSPLPVCEAVISQLRSQLMAIHRRPINAEQLKPYLHEFVFRFNECGSPKDRKEAFRQLLAAALPPIADRDTMDVEDSTGLAPKGELCV